MTCAANPPLAVLLARTAVQVRELHMLGINPDPFLHCMPCIDLAMPPDHNMVLNEAVEVPSWMSTSFGQVLGIFSSLGLINYSRMCVLEYVRLFSLPGKSLGNFSCGKI